MELWFVAFVCNMYLGVAPVLANPPNTQGRTCLGHSVRLLGFLSFSQMLLIPTWSCVLMYLVVLVLLTCCVVYKIIIHQQLNPKVSAKISNEIFAQRGKLLLFFTIFPFLGALFFFPVPVSLVFPFFLPHIHTEEGVSLYLYGLCLALSGTRIMNIN